ncbi:MAG TPA: LysM peptidoglycan-binding domain-containing protein [Opitutaceae bacterium]|nr:LysM peptidoglycan-binding domain-containing protein [Opitutaceae bacterium]
MKSALLLALAVLFAAVAHAQTDSPVITRAPIAADEKSTPSSADAAELADLRAQNKKLGAELALAWKDNDRLKTSALTQVAAANQKAETSEARTASATNSLIQVQNDLDAKTKELSTQGTLLADTQKSLDDLRKTAATSDPAALTAAQHDLAVQNEKVAALEAERADLQQKLAQTQAGAAAATEPAEPTDLEKQAAETEDKLNMSLRAYTLLQNDDDQLKDSLAKITDERDSLTAQLNDAKHLADDRQASLNQQAQQIAALQAAATTDANNIAALHDQVRQMQNLVAQLASENSQLKTRLVLDAPTTSAPEPARFASAPAPALAPSPAPAPAPNAPPPAETGPRTYKVASGDTLAKISKQYYGTTSHWQQILAANHDKLRDDKSLRVGMELTIP